MRNGESIEEMFSERQSLYEKYADFVIDCDEKEIEDTVLNIVRVASEI